MSVEALTEAEAKVLLKITNRGLGLRLARSLIEEEMRTLKESSKSLTGEARVTKGLQMLLLGLALESLKET